MRKIFFVFAVVLMVSAVMLAACQSEEDKAGEAYLTTKISCTKANVGARMCRIDLAWKCSKSLVGSSYSWTKTKEKCATPTCALTEKDCPMICAECAIGSSGGGCAGGVDYERCVCKKPGPCTPINTPTNQTNST